METFSPVVINYILELFELLVTLKNEMNRRFNDIKNLRNAFRFIENPWAVTTKEIFEINMYYES